MAFDLQNLAEMKFMKGLQKVSVKLSQSPAFSTISRGMGATMGLIMFGAVVQIVCAIGGLVFGWTAGTPIYDMLYMPYQLTMGLLGLFMSFTLAYTYAERLQVTAKLQAGFTSMVCFILVSSPIIKATNGAGGTFDALNLGALGASGIFSAILIGLISVRITKLAVDKNWIIKMPDVVPEGIINSFNSIIPTAINIILWYGLSLVISNVTGGALTLASVITTIIAIPLRYLITPAGMAVIVILFSISWFFGIHGGSVVFTAIMIPYFTAYATNAEMAAQGLPLVFSPVFLYGCIALFGGSGNTLALCLLGLKSKSKQISAVAKASLVPGLFNINEPAIFGFPILYNPILIIPFMLNSLVVMVFMYFGFTTGLLALPQVLIMTTLPIGVQQFMATLDWKNVVFVFLMAPIITAIYYPFFKVYEKQCIAKEQAEEAATLANH